MSSSATAAVKTT